MLNLEAEFVKNTAEDGSRNNTDFYEKPKLKLLLV